MLNNLKYFSEWTHIIELSKAICKLKVRGEWLLAEMTEKTRKLFDKIGIDYLIKRS